MALTTSFLTLNISLQATGTSLVQAIEAALAEQGEPLRWAITQVNPDRQTATVEAVITVETTP